MKLSLNEEIDSLKEKVDSLECLRKTNELLKESLKTSAADKTVPGQVSSTE